MSDFEEIIEEAKTKILKSEEYISVKKGFFPHLYKFGNKEKEIVFFAATHEPESKEEQFEKIKQVFDELKPEVILVEGIHPFSGEDAITKEEAREKRIKDTSWEETKKLKGEGFFAYKLGLENGALVLSPEFARQDEITILEDNNFTLDQIFLYIGTRTAMNYSYEPRSETLQSYMEKVFKLAYTDNDIKYDYSYSHFVTLVKENFGDSVDLMSGKGFKQKYDPIPPKEGSDRIEYSTNKASRTISRKRNEKILETIAREIKNHNKVFVVYGGSHALFLEPALRYLIEKI